jgi:hypothetical protein
VSLPADILDAQPPPLWDTRRLWSLWDMLTKLDAARLTDCINAIAEIKQIIDIVPQFKPDEVFKVPADQFSHFLSDLEFLRNHLSELGLRVSSARIQELKTFFQLYTRPEGAEFPLKMVEDKVRDVVPLIKTETQTHLFLHISQDVADYYLIKEPFGDDFVNKMPPDALVDVEEAGKCLALEHDLVRPKHNRH